MSICPYAMHARPPATRETAVCALSPSALVPLHTRTTEPHYTPKPCPVGAYCTTL